MYTQCTVQWSCFSPRIKCWQGSRASLFICDLNKPTKLLTLKYFIAFIIYWTFHCEVIYLHYYSGLRERKLVTTFLFISEHFLKDLKLFSICRFLSYYQNQTTYSLHLTVKSIIYKRVLDLVDCQSLSRLHITPEILGTLGTCYHHQEIPSNLKLKL